MEIDNLVVAAEEIERNMGIDDPMEIDFDLSPKEQIKNILLRYARAAEKITRTLLPRTGNVYDKWNRNDFDKGLKVIFTDISYMNVTNIFESAVKAIMVGTGNCDHNAYIAFVYLYGKLNFINRRIQNITYTSKKCKIQIIGGEGHSYCMLRYSDSNEEIGVICDPWCETVALCNLQNGRIQNITDKADGCIEMQRNILAGGTEWFKCFKEGFVSFSSEENRDNQNLFSICENYAPRQREKIKEDAQRLRPNLSAYPVYGTPNFRSRRGSDASTLSFNSIYDEGGCDEELKQAAKREQNDILSWIKCVRRV